MKMAKLTKEDFISSLKEMNLLEIKELVDAMKEEFGVDPSAVAVAAPAAGGAAGAHDARPCGQCAAGAGGGRRPQCRYAGGPHGRQHAGAGCPARRCGCTGTGRYLCTGAYHRCAAVHADGRACVKKKAVQLSPALLPKKTQKRTAVSPADMV